LAWLRELLARTAWCSLILLLSAAALFRTRLFTGGVSGAA